METSYRCPVCETSKNSAGAPFVSEWAVATHVAGKINAGDRLHRSWARSVPNVDLKLQGFQLAEHLLWPIHVVVQTEAAVEEGEAPPRRRIGF